MAGILILLAIVGYMEAVNVHGDARVAAFWRRPAPQEIARQADGVPPVPVLPVLPAAPATRFGVPLHALPGAVDQLPPVE